MMWALVNVSRLHMMNGLNKASRAYRPMRRAALNCTARETATLRSRILTSVSSNLLKKIPKFSNLRECISPTLRRDTQRTSYESFAV